eukprot:scaffold310_cov335-Pavlova_lutheri.AAC.3
MAQTEARMADVEVRSGLVLAGISGLLEGRLTWQGIRRDSTRACRSTRPRGRCRRQRSKTSGLERYVRRKDVEHVDEGRSKALGRG